VKVSHLEIENFRGVKKASLLLPDHAVLIGDNNTGKSTVLEALDLVLGPDRLSRQSPIDEHDFHEGMYLAPAELDGQDQSARTCPDDDNAVRWRYFHRFACLRPFCRAAIIKVEDALIRDSGVNSSSFSGFRDAQSRKHASLFRLHLGRRGVTLAGT
jgi:hypothetical protein